MVSLLTQTVRRLAKLGRCGSFVLGWLQGLADYVLAYSICFISIYGLSYSEGGWALGFCLARQAAQSNMFLGASVFYLPASSLCGTNF